jgi:hypothetical protein
MKLLRTAESLAGAAAKAGMDEKTARKYRRLGKPPSQMKTPRNYLTRADDFAEVWEELEQLLERDPRLEAKTLMEHLCRQYPGEFQIGQVRTLQRRLKRWRAKSGPEREVYFPQEHEPGRQAQSDFTHMSDLGVRIAGQSFAHLLYHFTLTYSNWEAGTVCFGETFESLAEGVQNALWKLGGVPLEHRTDSLSAAVNNLKDQDEFTDRYRGLLEHYRLQASHTSAGRAHENGDVEQSHHRFKRAVSQALALRGSTEFDSRKQYQEFLDELLERRNSVRQERLAKELAVMRPLPSRRLEDYSIEIMKVTRNSTIAVRKNTYSVPSQLIGERVEVRVYAEQLEVWYGGQCQERMGRLRGNGGQAINYRHIIHSLVRKPGAFAHYKYQQSLFPRLLFRVAYDQLREQYPASAERQYIKILELAAKESESQVEATIRRLIESGTVVSYQQVLATCKSSEMAPFDPSTLAAAPRIELKVYDALLDQKEVTNSWNM